LNPEGIRVSREESAIFAFSSSQPGSTFECALDEGGPNPPDVEPWVPCSSPVAYWNLQDGEHKFEVRATNPEGVVEEPPVVYEWFVELGPDTVPPNTTITSGPAASDPLSVATFEFTGTDNRVAPLTFECAIDGTAYNSCTSPEQFSDLRRGSHLLLVRARDGVGNFDPTPARYEWIIQPPPITTITGAPAEITESTTARFDFVADVPGSTYWCWLDGVLEESCSSPREYTNLAHGEHYFAVLARGPNLAWEEQWVEYEWRIGDMTAPLTYIDSGPDIEQESGRAEFVFHSNEEGVTFECSLDGGDPVPCTSPFVVPRLAAGPHEMEIVAVHPPVRGSDGELLDPLYEPVPSHYAWTVVDRTPPDTAILYGPPATTAGNDAYFGFAASEGSATIECSLDFQGFGGCERHEVYTDLLEGEHVLHVRAVDDALNADQSPAGSPRATRR
jgi:hypothetical protein